MGEQWVPGVPPQLLLLSCFFFFWAPGNEGTEVVSILYYKCSSCFP